MAKYDTEQFLKDLVTLYKANLNTQITALNTEKGDFDIDTIESDAWYFQNLNDNVFNNTVFIAYGLEANAKVSEPQSTNYVKEISVFIEACMADNGDTSSENVMWQLLRYTRALEEVAFKNYQKIDSRVKIRVKNLEPTSFLLDGRLFRSAGINISAALTAD